MSNLYKENSVTGSSYIRAKSVQFNNQFDNQSVQFVEERIINLGENDVQVVPAKLSGCFLPFNQENALTEFDLKNPETGENLGATMSFQDMQVALYSLYIYAANHRDAEVIARQEAMAAAEAARLAEMEAMANTDPMV